MVGCDFNVVVIKIGTHWGFKWVLQTLFTKTSMSTFKILTRNIKSYVKFQNI